MSCVTRQIEEQGTFLFRRRSYLPFLFIPLIVVAIAGQTSAALNDHTAQMGSLVFLAISLLGVAVRCYVAGTVPAGTSGRNTREQLALELNTTGAYSVVRHPLYLGNFLIGLGAVSGTFSIWLPSVYVLAFWLYYERIMAAEERFLGQLFGNSFDCWAHGTPAFFPNWTRWQPPKLRLCCRTILRKEYMAVLVTSLLHISLFVATHQVLQRGGRTGIATLASTVGIVCTCFGIRALKKHTCCLQVEGR